MYAYLPRNGYGVTMATQIKTMKLWKKPDGTVLVTTFCPEAKSNKETEAQFVARATDLLKATSPEFLTYLEITIPRSDMNSITSGQGSGVYEKLKIDANNKPYVDGSVVTSKESFNAKVDALHTKLIGLGLSKAESDMIIRKRGV